MASTNQTNDIDDIVVMDPPPRSRHSSGRSGRWQKKIQKVINENPNTWVQFATGMKSPAYFYALSGKHDNVEVTTRQQEDKTFDIYIKVNV